jgi:diacylglycerol kinase family enzyme
VARLTTGLRRALLVVNPAARRAARREAAAVAAFARAGVGCDVARTERPGHAAELVRAGLAFAPPPAGYDAVFTLGGDGTAMEVVGALAGSDVPVGILPGGTGNLVARTLGVPLDVGAAVAALLGGARARVDLGLVAAAGGAPRHFAFAAGVGIDARMIEETPAVWKRRLGVLAYALTACARDRRWAALHGPRDRRWRDDRARGVAVLVANFGAVLGELIHFGPGIREDDGRLDLCVFSPDSTADAVRVMWRLFRKDFRDDRCVIYRAGREFRIETTPPQAAQADGELLGRTPLVAHVVPRAATLLVPQR